MNEGEGNTGRESETPDASFYRIRVDDRKSAVNLVGIGTLVLGALGLFYTWGHNSGETLDTRFRNVRTECRNDLTEFKSDVKERFKYCRCR